MPIRVGILSMQRIKNYGSFLQAYGLKHILEDLGCEVQFVDYHPGETLISADGGTGLSRKLSKVTDVIKQDGPLNLRRRFGLSDIKRTTLRIITHISELQKR